MVFSCLEQTSWTGGLSLYSAWGCILFIPNKVYKLFLNQLLHLKMKRLHKKFSGNTNKAISHTAHISWSHVAADPVWLPACTLWGLPRPPPGLSLLSGLLPSSTSLVCSLYTSELLTPDLTRLQEGGSQDSRLQPASMRTSWCKTNRKGPVIASYILQPLLTESLTERVRLCIYDAT